ncbi:MAG: rhodanese-like domain-containing protein [Chloroflexota bacterium]|nr:rhodanese-like domain-containing protein [Chloroflexota bacterium]
MDAGKSLQIVDVREAQEYVEAHVEGSTLIPLGQLSTRLGELREDQPVVAMCRSGNRSSVAVSMLLRAGFRDVSNLEGGILAWAKSGLPVKRGK